MSLAFDPSSVFSQAIEDHLAVIDLLRDQQSLLQGIGEEMTRTILAGKKKCSGAEMGGAPQTLSTWRQS